MRINSINDLPEKYRQQAAAQIKAQRPVAARSAGIGKFLRAMTVDDTTDADIKCGQISEISFSFPLRVLSEANQHEHWSKKNKRKVAQQNETAAMWRFHVGQKSIKLPCAITFTKFGPTLLDSDNLQGAFKHVRDEVARQLGVDDGDTTKVVYRAQQKKITGKQKHRHWISIDIRFE